ncbi:MAG: helix-turn-helix domain-containing protein [Bacteroidota bacterium]
MKNDYEELYKELRKKYTDEEIVDSMLIPANGDEATRAQFVAWRMQRRENRTAQEILLSKLLGFKYRLLNYLENSSFSADQTFGKQLQQYLTIVNRKQKELAADINIHPSRLNRIIKGKERINNVIAYRLERHSGDLIPAIYWWKLMQKEVEEEIKNEQEIRKAAQQEVRYIVYEG